MSTITVELSDDVLAHVEQAASADRIGPSDWLSRAITAAMRDHASAARLLDERARRGNLEAAKAVLRKRSSVHPAPGDELP